MGVGHSAPFWFRKGYPKATKEAVVPSFIRWNAEPCGRGVFRKAGGWKQVASSQGAEMLGEVCLDAASFLLSMIAIPTVFKGNPEKPLDEPNWKPEGAKEAKGPKGNQKEVRSTPRGHQPFYQKHVSVANKNGFSCVFRSWQVCFRFRSPRPAKTGTS